MTMLSKYIKGLLQDPPYLTPQDLSDVLRLVFQDEATELQIASFLTALRMSGLDHKPEYISSAANTILEFSSTIANDTLDPLGYIDIVGTGGDGQNTFNVSTSAAIVAAGMGLPVCKHGGKASTSASGAGDLMKYLGIDLFKVNNKTTPAIVSKSNFCFLFAPSFHPVMGKVAGIRASLGIPSIFNILGPLMNPIPLRARILGVYTEALGEVYAQAALVMDEKRGKVASTMVVWGECGLDEIAPVGRTKVWRVDPQTKTISSFYIAPSDFGLPEHSLDEVKSGTPEENAVVLRKLLRGEMGVSGHPLVDYIVMNSAALAVVAGIAKDWKQGVDLARKSISSGDALDSLNCFIETLDTVEI